MRREMYGINDGDRFLRQVLMAGGARRAFCSDPRGRSGTPMNLNQSLTYSCQDRQTLGGPHQGPQAEV